VRGGSFVDGHETVTNGHLGGIALGLVAGRGVETPALKDKADIRIMVIETKCGLLVMILNLNVRLAHNAGYQLRRAIGIRAEGKRLLEKHVIAPSAARLCGAAHD